MTLLDQIEEPDLESPAESPADDFDDLEQLLAGAVKAAEAKKTLKSLKRTKIGTLTEEDIQALANANEALTWDDESAIARFIETHCLCGSSTRRFDGWFIVSQHRRDASARRYRRSEDHEGLPAWRYVTLEEVGGCCECLQLDELPLATEEDLPGIEALGECPQCECEQLVLELDAVAEQQMNDLLEELKEELPL
jgi:hypothetical protein